MVLYVLRHAEKEQGDFHNPQLRHEDAPLSAKGWQTAQKMVTTLASKPIVAIYVSAYQRTWQAISTLAEQIRLTPVVDRRLNEIDNGDVDEMTEQEFQRIYPDAWQAYVERVADFRFPGGETGAEVEARIKEFVDEKRVQHVGDAILLVCHDGLIRQLMCYVLGLPVYRRGDFQTDMCGLTELRLEEDSGRWRLRRFNQVWE